MTVPSCAGSDGYELRSFRVKATDVDQRTRNWLEATALGFHQEPPSAEHTQRVAASYERDDRVLTAAYVAGSRAGAWEASRPVATYATFVKSLNVGNGNLLDAHLVAGVTVRPTHRRRGLLRTMVSADLRRAAQDGHAVAALRSMEATIYGRFGFGPAVFTRAVEVDTGDRFALARSHQGEVEVADPHVLLDLAPTVFDGFHARTSGSLQRQASFPSTIAGIWAEDRPEPDLGVRAALHYDPTGRVDGYVTYRFLGWDVQPRTVEVLDLVGESVDAHLGLWDYLASIDLVTRVRLAHASLADPLPWTMADRRGYVVTGEEDALWLRVLDPVAALETRSYEVDGEVTIGLSDPLGLGDGAYTLVVREGKATVTPTRATESADVFMDISVLGSLYLGGVRARALARAGRVTARADEAIDRLDAVMAHREPPFCITHF